VAKLKFAARADFYEWRKTVSTPEMTKLSATSRSGGGKGFSRKLRASGKIPVVCYGHETGTTSLSIVPGDLHAILTGPYQKNTVFSLQVDDGPDFRHVMVKDYQIDPVRRTLLHADLIVLNPEKALRVTVPVEPIGISPDMKTGGLLQRVRASIRLHTRPDDIPEVVHHEVSQLQLGQSVLASDLTIPEGMTWADKVDYAVFQLIAPRGVSEDEEGAQGLEESSTEEDE
jgi:large subunit ribosomal protein L25